MPKQLRKIAWRYSAFFFFSLAAIFILAGIYLLATRQIRISTDLLLSGESLHLGTLMPVMAVLIAGGMLASWLSAALSNRFSMYTIWSIREKIALKIADLPFAYLDKNGKGSLLSKLTGDISETANLMQNSLPSFCRSVIQIVCYAGFLFFINPLLTIVSLILYPLVMAAANRANKKMAKLSRLRREAIDNLAAEVTDAVGGVYIEKSYNLDGVITQKLDIAVEKALKPDLDRVRVSSVVYLLSYLSEWLPLIVCSFFAAFIAFDGGMSNGSLIAFILLLGSLRGPIGELPYVSMNMRQQLVSAHRLEELLALDGEPSGTRTAESHTIALRIENIGFSYSDSPVLHDISFKIRCGQHVAFVGRSGCGKTTLMKLLTGFYQPNHGKYSLYELPFSEWDLSKAREQFAIVSQDIFLFPDTIRRNIALGRGGVSPQEIEEAAKAAGIHDFIVSLPEGYDSVVGERGVKLSGGERQRISIARAIIKNAPILLLDEPTSSLDIATESVIEHSLASLSKSRTVITIAHRLSTIQNADEIFVMDKGRMVECGTHETLLSSNGIYAALYRTQQNEGAVSDEN